MINKKWDIVLEDEMKKDYFKKLGAFVRDEYTHKIVYPEYKNIFNALRYTDYDDVKVVILGQDPYHGEREAHGLSFSVQEGVAIPPSLQNIFTELESDIGVKRTSTDLTDWAKKGVLLLNSIMTVIKDRPLSHKDKGWETFTDNIIQKLNEREETIVFILWGSYARSKKVLITNTKHKIIESVHPFSKANAYLEAAGTKGIEW